MSVQSYDVGGILYPRPFRVRRLGHFGFNLSSLDAGLDFYGRLLGFRLTDEARLSRLLPDLAVTAQDDRLFFMTHNTDHHAFLLAHRSLGALFGDDAGAKDITLSQITWQVGTLEEVVRAVEFFDRGGVEIRRSGRDMPGSNWHVYVRDPDGHTVELYYGMEQVGLNGRSKPSEMYYRRFLDTPPLPQMSDIAEAADAQARGIDLLSGYRIRDLAAEKDFDVGGVLLPRPFKITKIGPAALFVDDVEASEIFYRDTMGFSVTEVIEWRGHRCVFMRHGNEHHSLKLLPRAARAELGLSAHTSCMSMGLQVGTYRQLRDAVAWLEKQGVTFVDLPAELSPGIDYCAHFLDPEGHCLQIYYYMEQVGWDGQVRAAGQRRAPVAPWPEALEPLADTYVDQVFQGPLG